MPSVLLMLGSFFPPDLSATYLRALIGPVGVTLGLVTGAMTLAVLIALPLSLAVALRLPGARLIVATLSLARGIPDLTLAILCVMLFGLGPGAALIALALYYAAMLARMFPDILDTAPAAPLRALQATGATPLQILLFGQLPLTMPDLLSYGAYSFECALRASVIVGAVGGGGIGAELLATLAGFDFQHATTLILILVAIILLLDRAAILLRDHPHWLPILLVPGIACMAHFWPEFWALHHALSIFWKMFPPHLTVPGWLSLPGLIWETLAMALAGTLGAAALAIPCALAASHTLAPGWLSWPVRRLMDLLRTIPELVYGLVLIAIVGVGPMAGAWALGLHSLGSLTRLFADTLDNAPAAPQRAIASTGASPLIVGAFATIPLALGPMLTHLLFRLEWNLRMATVLGLIGAGGIGQALYQAQQLFFYRQMLAYVLVTGLLILLNDQLAKALRRALGTTGALGLGATRSRLQPGAPVQANCR